MIQFHITEAARLVDATPQSLDLIFTGIGHDTRTLVPGNLFVAIRGERIDGHHLLAEAAAKGAKAALVNYPILDCPASLPQLIVKDTITALGDLARHWRKQFKIPIIAVTGSNGKTTVKNMIESIFQAAVRKQAVLATQGNFNNTLGLPLTLALLGPEHRLAVLEMGMNQFGEIARLSDIAKPSIALITNAATAHLAGVSDVAGVAKAKGEIFSGLTESGMAILNADDAYYSYWQHLTRQHTCITFGLESPADVSAIFTGRPEIELKTPAGNINLSLPLPGRHNLMNALAATAAALAADIPLDTIREGLTHIQPAPGRMIYHALANGAQLIDDSYNANPFSLSAAVAVLVTSPGEKILILGDMKELGPHEIALHTEAGLKIAAAGVDRLLTYGTLSAHTAKAFGPSAKHFTSQAELLYTLRPLIKKNTTLLVKGSRSMEMDKIITALLPEKFIPSH